MKNNNAMNDAINAILANIGNNPEAMKALLEAIAETGKIAKDNKSEEAKKSCRYIICLECDTVNGDSVYHPFVMSSPRSEDPKMLIADNAVKAQNMAQSYGMMIHDNVYAMPATEDQITKLYDLLKECNKRIVDAVDTAVDAVSTITPNIDKDALCIQYMQQMMQNCRGVIGSSMTVDSKIIEEDIEIVRRNDDECDCDEDEDWDEEFEDDCDCCDCDCCPNNLNN